jgi:hypothetical protein
MPVNGTVPGAAATARPRGGFPARRLAAAALLPVLTIAVVVAGLPVASPLSRWSPSA